MIQRYMTPFLNWWVGQLTGLLPARLLDAYVEAGDATILEMSGDRFVLSAKRGGILQQVGEGALRELGQALASDLPQLRLLRVPQAQALRKTLVLPYAARHDLKAVLSSEIDRETPFEQSEVYWSHAVTGQDSARSKLEIALVILPRRVGGALAARAREAGFQPAALAIGTDGEKATLLWMDGHHRPPLPRFQPRNKKLAAGLYALAAAILVVPLAVQQVHFFLADRTIAELETKAHAASTLQQAANRRMAAMEFMGHRNGANGSALKILQGVTRALPDDTFLTGLAVHGGQVTMTGSSEVAANLIKAVGKTSQFRDPVFESAVIENPDTDLENFTISAKLVDSP